MEANKIKRTTWKKCNRCIKKKKYGKKYLAIYKLYVNILIKELKCVLKVNKR